MPHNKNLLTNITLSNQSSECINRVLQPAVTPEQFNVLNKSWSIRLPQSFSIYRNKACTISVTSAFLTFNKSASVYSSAQAGSVILAADIPVQGCCMNLPFYPDGQVVQTSMALNNTFNSSLQHYVSSETNPTMFRCQGLPDIINVFMLQSSFSSTTLQSPIITNPDLFNMTLQIEFDEER